MIYDRNRVTIPTLCPIQFAEPTDSSYYPYQDSYIGKLNVDSTIMFLITQGDYVAQDECTLLMFNAKTKKLISITYMTKVQLSASYHYVTATLDGTLAANTLVYFEIQYAGDDSIARSLIYEAKPKYTKHLKTIGYTHSENDWNTVFGNYAISVECGFNPNDFKATADTENYQDQNVVNNIIYGQPYSTEILSIGGNQGIPNWMYEKLNAIFMCDTITIAGVAYTVANGASLEKIDQTYDGLARYKIELQKTNTFSQ